MPRFRYTLLLLLIALLPAAAQAQQGAGAVTLREWPAALYDGAEAYPYDLLLALDELELDYRYRVRRGRPHLRGKIAWTPGPVGVRDNRVVEADQIPYDVRIVALTLGADVVSGGEAVGRLSLVLDSLALPPRPEHVRFIVDDRAWAEFFDDLDAEAARAVFDEGFTLASLDVLSIAFARFEDDRHDYYPRRPAGIHAPDWVQIFIPRWPGGRQRGAGKRGEPATGPKRAPREGVGRTPTTTDTERPRTRDGRTRNGDDEAEEADRTERQPRADRTARRGDRTGKSAPKRPGKKSDDKDDDDAELMPAALMGAAAIGAVAFGGGTLGYFGNAEAPIGLAAGRVQPHAGVLFQVAANEAALGGEGTERLVGRITTFYDLFGWPVQPALGLGVVAEAAGEDEVALSPSLALGAVANVGPLLILGGYDLAAGGVDFGVAFNWRRAFLGR